MKFNQPYMRRFQVCLKDVKFFYAEECCGITTSVNSDMKTAIYKLKRYLEVTYGSKVQQVGKHERRTYSRGTH